MPSFLSSSLISDPRFSFPSPQALLSHYTGLVRTRARVCIVSSRLVVLAHPISPICSAVSRSSLHLSLPTPLSSTLESRFVVRLSLSLFLPFSTYVNTVLFLCYLIRSCTISHQHFFLLYLPQRHVVVREYRDTEESADAQTQHSRCHQSAGSAVAAIISHQPRQAKAATHSLSLSTLCPLRKARPLVVAQK